MCCALYSSIHFDKDKPHLLYGLHCCWLILICYCGGLYLEVNAKFHVLKRLLKFKPYDEGYISLVLFYENTADYGGAVYIADDTNSAMCASFSFKEYSAPTECSIQTLTLHGEVYDSLHHDDIIFARNYAYTSGTTLFAGLLLSAHLLKYTIQ